MMKSILIILISFALVVSGASQTRNVVVGTNGAVVQPTNFWSADASNARTGLGLGSSATNPAAAFQSSSSVLSNLASSNAVNLTNVRATNIVGSIALASNVSGIVSIANGGTGGSTAGEARTNLNAQQASIVLSNLANSNGGNLTNLNISNLGTILITGGGTGATNAATARTNLGLGWSALTNTNAATSLLGFTTNGQVVANTGTNVLTFTSGVAMNKLQLPNGTFVDDAQFAAPQYADAVLSFEENRLYQHGLNIIEWSTNGAVTFGNAAATRTNLGLGSSWLTNTNNPVFINTNGEVVSPTNFWQVAPIQTLVQTFAQVTNSTNAATNARNLYVYSLATNIINVTNTITLPTNTSAFDGDEVTVIHRGGSNSVTTVRQLGSTNNLISLNSYDESVKFIKDGNWDFYHNISFTEAIRFSGTNAAANAGASRTNLGLGGNNDVIFNSAKIYDTTISNNIAVFASTNFYVSFEEGAIGVGDPNNSSNILVGFEKTNQVIFSYSINFATNAISNAAAITRTNLGLPLAALTNTNNDKFQEAIFTTNTAPTNAGNFGNNVAWMGVSIVTNGVTNTFLIPLYK